MPGGGLRETCQKPAVQHRWVEPQQLVQQLASALALHAQTMISDSDVSKVSNKGDLEGWVVYTSVLALQIQ